MRTSNDYRIYLERLILSACLQEDGYHQIAGVLTSKNFSPANIEKDVNLNHQQIFAACERVYPFKQIARVTLWNYLGRTKEVGRILCEFQTYVCNTDNIKEHAFLLIELCIRESFVTLLSSLSTNENSSPKLRITISEFLKTELGFGDVWYSIARAKEVIGQVDSNALYSIQMFEDLIDRKAYELKDQIHVDRLFWYIGKLACNVDTNGEIGIEHTRKIIKSITLNGTISLSELTKLLDVRLTKEL